MCWPPRRRRSQRCVPALDFRAYYRAGARQLAEGLAELGVLPVSVDPEESLQPDC